MTLKEGTDLHEQLGYQLQRINLQLMDRARVALCEFRISPAKVAAMVLIRDNAGCDQSALGRALSINRASAMKLVNALAECDYVERRPGRDLRTIALHLTRNGHEALGRMIIALRASETDFSAPLDCAEQAELMRLLRKLRRGRTRAAGSKMPLA